MQKKKKARRVSVTAQLKNAREEIGYLKDDLIDAEQEVGILKEEIIGLKDECKCERLNAEAKTKVAQNYDNAYHHAQAMLYAVMTAAGIHTTNLALEAMIQFDLAPALKMELYIMDEPVKVLTRTFAFRRNQMIEKVNEWLSKKKHSSSKQFDKWLKEQNH